MLDNKKAVQKVALTLPAKLSVTTDDCETFVYDAKTRLINISGLLLTIVSNTDHALSEDDVVTCTFSYKRKIFYSNCVIVKVKSNELVVKFINTEFERLMVLKYILENG